MEGAYEFVRVNIGVALSVLLVLGLLYRPVKGMVITVVDFIRDWQIIKSAVLGTVPNGGDTDGLGDRVVRVEEGVRHLNTNQDRIIETLETQSKTQQDISESLASLRGKLEGWIAHE